jgi:hypothetical protein
MGLKISPEFGLPFPVHSKRCFFNKNSSKLEFEAIVAWNETCQKNSKKVLSFFCIQFQVLDPKNSETFQLGMI